MVMFSCGYVMLRSLYWSVTWYKVKAVKSISCLQSVERWLIVLLEFEQRAE